MWAGLPCAGYLVKILARQRDVVSGQEKPSLAIKDRILCRQSLTTTVQPYVPEYGLRAWCVLEPGSSGFCGRQGATEMTPVRGQVSVFGLVVRLSPARMPVWASTRVYLRQM